MFFLTDKFDDEQPKISGKTIQLNIGGKIVNLKSNKWSYYSYTFTPNFIGSTSIVATFAGDSYCTASSKTSTIKIVRFKTSLTINKFKTLFKKSNVIKATIKDLKGYHLGPGRTIKLFVNGKAIASAKTNSAGVASFKYTFKTKKTHNIVAKFSGNSFYLPKNSATFKAIPR